MGLKMKQPPTIKRMEEEFDVKFVGYGHTRSEIQKDAVGDYAEFYIQDLKDWFSSYFEEVLEYLKLEKRNTGYPTDISWDEAVDELNAKIAHIARGK